MLTKPKTTSVIGSEIKGTPQMGYSGNDVMEWYYTAFQNRSQYNSAPAFLPQYKESHPYCLTIHKIQGLSINKKNASSSLFLNLSGMLITGRFDILGVAFNYQYEECLGRNEAKWEVPVSLYFHSRIDKNYEDLYLLIRIKAVQMRDNIVETVNNVGTIVIKTPFLEETNKAIFVPKDLNEAQFGFMPTEAKNRLITTTSPLTVHYSVQSILQLKKLTKIVPQNSLFTHQSSITGLKNNQIPRDNTQYTLKEASAVQLTVVFLQVHISEKFDQDFLGYFKKIFPNEKGTDVKNRKIVVGYHNQYCLVNPNARKLEFIDKQIAGQTRVSIYESLREGQVMKLPFYIDKNHCCGVIAIGVIYQVNQREVEVACYYLLPADKGEDISQRMMTGGGYGAVHQMLQFPTTDAPTLLLEYECDFHQTQNSLKEEEQLTMREISSRKMVDEEAAARQKQKLREEIERERLQILKEKEEMEKIKNENYQQFQTEFEKKFQLEKENLYKKQQMIEHQYKEQVEREIRERFQLEEEIKKMTEKLRNIEEENFKQVAVISHPLSDPEPTYAGSPKFQVREAPSNTLFPRQRIDPGYIIEPQNPIPVKKIREIIEKGPKVNSELIKISEEQFNYASKFTFSFISIVWSGLINPPKTIYLVIRFFNQQEFRTDSIGYLETGEGGYHQLIRITHFSKGHQSKEPTYTFLIDPSQYHQPHMVQKDLIAYLANNSAIVDVFCGQSHLYIGQINVKLKQLIRGNKSQTLIAKELNLVRLKDKEHLGVIQVLIKNEQTVSKDEVCLKEMKKVKDLKKKVISNNPIVISGQDKVRSHREKEGRGELIKSKAVSTTRQELRIQKYKEQKAMKTFTQTANGFTHLQEHQKATVLNQIINYKQKKMDDYIKGVYANLLNQQINLSAHFGKAVTFPYLFQNTSQTSSSFKIAIMYVGEENSQQLSVVKGSKQWRYFVTEHNYSEPKRYDMLGENNTFFLHAGQSIPLIFKFLSFRKESKQRVINVTICKEDNNWITGGFSLYVQMHEPVIHHSYILYEPGDQMVDIIVPVIYSQTDNTSTPKRLHLTDSNPSSTAQWLNPYEILIRVETPKIMQKIKFNLLLYNDEYCCELTQNWLIEIHSYEGVCAYFRSDFNTKFKITMPWSAVPPHLGLLSLDRATSNLKLYASSSALIFKDDIIEIDSDRRDEGGCEIWCELLGGENVRKSAEVTCVSGEESQLIYGWTVTVYPYISRS